MLEVTEMAEVADNGINFVSTSDVRRMRMAFTITFPGAVPPQARLHNPFPDSVLYRVELEDLCPEHRGFVHGFAFGLQAAEICIDGAPTDEPILRTVNSSPEA